MSGYNLKMNTENAEKKQRIKPTYAERTILDNAVAVTLKFAACLQLSVLVSFFLNLLRSKHSPNAKDGMGLSKKLFEHFTDVLIEDEATSPGARFIQTASAYLEARSKYPKGNDLEEESHRVLGKRVFNLGNCRANVFVVREALAAKQCRLDSSVIYDSLVIKSNKKLNELRACQMVKNTGILDLSVIWPRKYAVDPSEVIAVIRTTVQQQVVYGVDIRGFINIMGPLETFIQFLGVLVNTTVCMLGLGEDLNVLTKAHFEVFRAMIVSGQLSIRRYYVNILPRSRRTMLLALNLVGPAKKQSSSSSKKQTQKNNIYTVFTYAKREDFILWKSINDVELRKQQPRLAWLHAPKQFWDNDIVHKAALQHSVTNYDTAQQFINNN